jgi:hypothetical protein
MVECTQISDGNTAYEQNQGQIPHYHLSSCRKVLWQNSTSCFGKSPEVARNGRIIPQNNKTYEPIYSQNYIEFVKSKSISSKIKNETNRCTLSIFIQHSA